MTAGDVTDTLELALEASGCDQAAVRHKPRLLSDNGASYISGELADMFEARHTIRKHRERLNAGTKP